MGFWEFWVIVYRGKIGNIVAVKIGDIVVVLMMRSFMINIKIESRRRVRRFWCDVEIGEVLV